MQLFGPYRIAGWSFGGNLAYEIATQLLGEDETVEFPGLIDAVNFAGTGRIERPSLDDSAMLLADVLPMVDETDYALRAQLESLARSADLDMFVNICHQKQLIPRNMSLEDIQNCYVRMRASVHALDQYHPLPIPIFLFRAMDHETPARDANLGWAEVLPEAQIRLIPIPGTHISVMSPPKIEMLGQSLSDAIRGKACRVQKLLIFIVVIKEPISNILYYSPWK